MCALLPRLDVARQLQDLLRMGLEAWAAKCQIATRTTVANAMTGRTQALVHLTVQRFRHPLPTPLVEHRIAVGTHGRLRRLGAHLANIVHALTDEDGRGRVCCAAPTYPALLGIGVLPRLGKFEKRPCRCKTACQAPQGMRVSPCTRVLGEYSAADRRRGKTCRNFGRTKAFRPSAGSAPLMTISPAQ